MIQKKTITYLTAILVIVISVIAIIVVSLQEKTPTEIPDANIIYANAADATGDIRDMVLKVSKTQKIQLETETLSETSDYTISCKNLYSDGLEIALEETLSVGKHSVDISEVFLGGTVYSTVNNGHFSCEMGAEEYGGRLPPAILLDPEIYASITGIDDGDGYLITFSQPSAPEAWAVQEDTAFVGASGTAYVNYSGELVKSTYTLDYTQQSYQHQLTVTTEITGNTPVISVPENAGEYIKIDYLDGPRLLERSSGYLTQINNITAISKDTTYFQAFGDEQIRDITVKANQSSDWSAQVDTVITLKNEGRLGQDSVLQQTETFKNNIYTLHTDENKQTSDSSITQEHMHTYCQNLLVSTIMLPQFITNCTYLPSENTLRITYSANDEFAKQIQANAYDALYKTPEMFQAISETAVTDTMYCYLDIDPETGLPIGSGMLYSCFYTAEGIPYSLKFQADQTYRIGTQ